MRCNTKNNPTKKTRPNRYWFLVYIGLGYVISVSNWGETSSAVLYACMYDVRVIGCPSWRHGDCLSGIESNERSFHPSFELRCNWTLPISTVVTTDSYGSFTYAAAAENNGSFTSIEAAASMGRAGVWMISAGSAKSMAAGSEVEIPYHMLYTSYISHSKCHPWNDCRLAYL